MKRNCWAVWFSALLLLAAILACGPSTPRPPLKFSPDQLPDAQTGVAYDEKIQISDNVTPVFTIYIIDGSLPDGLKLEYIEHDNYARIVGTPTVAGTFKFVVGAACLGTSVNGQGGAKEYTLIVK